MAGVKGKSGRKSLRDWEKHYRIIDKAWSILEEYLNDLTITPKEKIDTVCKVIVKDMPEKITDGEGNTLPSPVINIYGNRNPDTSNRMLHPIEGNQDSGEARLPV